MYLYTPHMSTLNNDTLNLGLNTQDIKLSPPVILELWSSGQGLPRETTDLK